MQSSRVLKTPKRLTIDKLEPFSRGCRECKFSYKAFSYKHKKNNKFNLHTSTFEDLFLVNK